MNSTGRLIYGWTNDFPQLREPKPEIADHGTIRFGSACITTGFSPRR